MPPRNRLREIAVYYRTAAEVERPGSLRERFARLAEQFGALADTQDRNALPPDKAGES